MKTRLHLTIEKKLLDKIKQYAISRGISISELVDNYFRAITRLTSEKNILREIEGLKKPHLDINTNLKQSFYRNQAKKYGF